MWRVCETHGAVLLFGAHTLKYQLLLHNYLHLEIAAVTFTHTWVRAKEADVNMDTKRCVKDKVAYCCFDGFYLLWSGCGCS